MPSELLYWLDDNRERGVYYRVRDQLHSMQSDYQRIEILDLHHYGKALVLSGEFQFSELDAPRYHELLVHPALLAHPKPERVLVFGGGDGFTALECVKHPSLKEVIVAELDPAVPEACKPFFRESREAFAHPKVKLQIGDAMEYVEQALARGERFDAVLSDLTSVVKTSPLHSQEFLGKVRKLLKPHANYANHFDLDGPFSTKKRRFVGPKTISTVFNHAGIAPFYMPAFIAEYAILVAGDAPLPPAEELARRAKERGLSFRFYDPLFHYPRMPEFLEREFRTVAPLARAPPEHEHPGHQHA
jgi:spermidine synthase